MSPMALSFWRDNRRVKNHKLTQKLGYALRYPSYREGLRPASWLRLTIDISLQIPQDGPSALRANR